MPCNEKLLAFVLFLLAPIACTTSPLPSGDGDAPIDVSISEIHEDPSFWHGKLVRVSGTFDECISYTCELCETEEALIALNKYYEDWLTSGDRSGKDAERMCAGVSFYNKQYLPENEKARAFLESTFTLSSAESEKMARFTTSTILAIYDSTCATTPGQEKSDTIVLCTDRASELDNAKIVRTHTQRPVTSGIINQYGIKPLGHLDSATKTAISKAYESSLAASSYEKGPPDFVFIFQEDQEWLSEYGISAVGGACVCLTDQCSEDDWPKREGDTWLVSPANPYVCWQAESADGTWRFPLQ